MKKFLENFIKKSNKKLAILKLYQAYWHRYTFYKKNHKSWMMQFAFPLESSNFTSGIQGLYWNVREHSIGAWDDNWQFCAIWSRV